MLSPLHMNLILTTILLENTYYYTHFIDEIKLMKYNDQENISLILGE